MSYLGRARDCAEDGEKRVGTHKNEASVTEFLMEIVDTSGVFFSPKT